MDICNHSNPLTSSIITPFRSFWLNFLNQGWAVYLTRLTWGQEFHRFKAKAIEPFSLFIPEGNDVNGS